MSGKQLKVGSRESNLAIAQTRMVMRAIKAYDPNIDLRMITMKTTGDIKLDSSLQEIGGKGLFVKELDQGLAEGKLDICVHSFKDMPFEENPLMPIVAASVREDVRDVIVLPKGKTSLPKNPVFGCSSLRRRVQLEQLYPGCRVEPVRGNVLSRLTKLDFGQVDALVLAAAGLKRLGLEERISRYLSIEKMLPASCQGIIAVQARKGEYVGYLRKFHNPEAWDASIAERSFVGALGADCNSPVGAYAITDGTEIKLKGMLVGKNGAIYKGMGNGQREDAVAVGVELALRLQAQADAGDKNG